ncbi:MAG TPA: hypothetical protein VFB78_07710 [Acidimicrobiales bacterium]|nr:hypothetical protein [Acidimicrobiales bacterium]
MEGEADRDDLRFRLDWPEDNLSKPDDALTDFSFEWDEEQVDAALAASGEPQSSEPLDILTSDVDTGFLDSSDALDTVRRALDDNNDALRQLSEAVYELASNVRALVDHVEGIGTVTVASGGGSHAGDVTATAMVTMSAEVTTAIEQLADEVHGTRQDVSGLMDDIVAAVGGEGLDVPSQSRLVVEIDRLHSELQALKRRLPVRAKELDAADIAERVVEAILTVLDTDAAIAPLPPTPAPRRRPVRAEPVEPAPRKRSRPLRPES